MAAAGLNRVRVHLLTGAKKAVGGMYIQLARDMLRGTGCPEEGKQRPNSDPGQRPVEEAEKGRVPWCPLPQVTDSPHPITLPSLESDGSPFVITRRTSSIGHWKAGPKNGVRERGNGSRPEMARTLAVP